MDRGQETTFGLTQFNILKRLGDLVKPGETGQIRSAERPTRQPKTPEEIARRIFQMALNAVLVEQVSPDIAKIMKEIDPRTGLLNSILWGRAIQDFRQGPDGVICFDFFEEKEVDAPFARMGEARLTTTGPDGQRVTHEKPVVLIILNTGAPGCKLDKKGTVRLSKKEMMSIIYGVLDAQSLIERRYREGTLVEVMRRGEFANLLKNSSDTSVTPIET